ncbi:Tubulin polyglutamylase complex subunit 2 [Paragonimus skrjabini miyazakii]|uniref:Tubulin polyglutamylase complex subunit 2 n=1 Tax=Paragonimus skrjabini miyazakii TaxID=59628 RepID=A0A8S9YYL6_9TREM|nr:Tubulin polyglutamylase complex subunit 2 [Paragonimus skrjabini miyazakii]
MVINLIHVLKTYLKSKPAVCEVNVETYPPVEKQSIDDWLQNNGVQLPEDVRNFYLTTNGLLLTWYNSIGETKSLIGRISINAIEKLKPVSFELDQVDFNSNLETSVDVFLSDLIGFEGDSPPNYMFLLECCNNSRVVLLILDELYSGIYLLDQDATFHKICDTLLQYLRLAIVHLGILDWHAWYTPIGPTPQALQYFALYTPERLSINTNCARTRLESDTKYFQPPVINSQKLQSIEGSAMERAGQTTKNVNVGSVKRRGKSTDSPYPKPMDVGNTGRKLRG